MRIRTPKNGSLFRYSVQQTIEAPVIRIYYYFCGSFFDFVFNQFWWFGICVIKHTPLLKNPSAWVVSFRSRRKYQFKCFANSFFSLSFSLSVDSTRSVANRSSHAHIILRPLERWERKSRITHQKWFIKTFYYDFHFSALYVRISIINYNCCWFIGSLNFVLLLLSCGMSALHVALNVLCFSMLLYSVCLFHVCLRRVGCV